MRAAQLLYTDAPIHVEIVQAADLQKALTGPSGDLGLSTFRCCSALQQQSHTSLMSYCPSKLCHVWVNDN